MAKNDKRGTDSPCGVLDFLPWDHDWNAHHYAPEKVTAAVKLMKKAGVGIVRMDFIWADVQPTKKKWDFKKFDFLTDTLDRNGIKVLGLLDYNARWAGPWNSAPDPASFVVYVRAVVRRYKGRIKYWELWNEPNMNIYWVPQDGMRAYTSLLKKVYKAVKAEDPTAQVVLGGLSGDAAAALRQVYQNGGKNSFDVVNFHPFQNPHSADAMTRMKTEYLAVYAEMKKSGDGEKPVWLTELGCPGMPAGKSTADWWIGRNPSEADQAAWVKKIYSEPLKWKGVEKIFWAFFRDTPNHFLTGTDYFGLVREDFSKKPAYEAYRRKASALKGRGRV